MNIGSELRESCCGALNVCLNCEHVAFCHTQIMFPCRSKPWFNVWEAYPRTGCTSYLLGGKFRIDSSCLKVSRQTCSFLYHFKNVTNNWYSAPTNKVPQPWARPRCLTERRVSGGDHVNVSRLTCVRLHWLMPISRPVSGRRRTNVGACPETAAGTERSQGAAARLFSMFHVLWGTIGAPC